MTASLELVKLTRVIVNMPISTSLQWNCMERRLTFKRIHRNFLLLNKKKYNFYLSRIHK